MYFVAGMQTATATLKGNIGVDNSNGIDIIGCLWCIIRCVSVKSQDISVAGSFAHKSNIHIAGLRKMKVMVVIKRKVLRVRLS